ncbi:MAG: 23S rRNA (uridine(2552)-2'-O)-methyltransferase RlmE [gamma proteobacterium symbiont of Bathyaustriella thionipta]|nr:23S rRNA (uridine(2552)-2'-O)-methyltransferase RlmE [gamma proteobacterium symbiont of Bathyaustriella thionipta]MCU7948848.1 23S rRNA (uridine(2552)-2'-O)-methyltransferase RlmE [gamma proteobacterium symbiont of Bathyaustriella thionipta]MCU7951943.1 23S rRNA (uridine(2552)-2'-O)-methyltransferase RlmE [gamma proteobacterium symbiont of Bathyaustriella thionipta]MCU7955422.1 23S rRNA (uridine(2552)-2'-O)-methyltransferase RlmE [gamma proteobacterium symbiont of Bathyaustriella thionipta]M
MARSKSSSEWLEEHFKDQYVLKSQQDGYRSRAAYKLLQIQEKDKIIKPGMNVVDLGAAPGGWSQVARQFVGSKGKIVALDILPMDQLAQVEFIQGDFQEDAVLEELLKVVNNEPIDLVISDMAPNVTGVKAVDQPKSMYLLELAIDLADQVLKPQGTLLMKVFQGEGFEQLLAELRQRYQKVITRKPDASRSRSSEVYLLAKGFKG